MELEQQEYLTRTRKAYLATRILDTPFWGLFNLLPFMLYKDAHISPFQLALIITLKPLSSIVSSYWSASFHQKPHKLVSSITSARWIAFLPFLAFPWIHNAWYSIACFGLFMLLQVGMMPAWMEILKQNLPSEERSKTFSFAQTFGYVGAGLTPFALGWALDEWTGSWRYLFPVASLLALCSYFWQKHILIKPRLINAPENHPHPILKPWKSAWGLLVKHPDFAKFQFGFMFLGCGLMIIQPILPVFIVDKLHLSYTQLGGAITLCKGVGFACSSILWTRMMQKMNLFQFSALISLFAAIFPCLLMLAQTEMIWLYVAYLAYGFTQAGNELSWNLSGPIFSKQEDSSLFSSVNVIFVGIRGIFIPSLGAYILADYGVYAVLTFSCLLCFIGAIRMALYHTKIAPQTI